MCAVATSDGNVWDRVYSVRFVLYQSITNQKITKQCEKEKAFRQRNCGSPSELKLKFMTMMAKESVSRPTLRLSLEGVGRTGENIPLILIQSIFRLPPRDTNGTPKRIQAIISHSNILFSEQ